MWMQREESRVKSRILVFEITFSILSANGFNLIFWDSQNHRERERQIFKVTPDTTIHVCPHFMLLYLLSLQWCFFLHESTGIEIHPASSIIPSYLLPVGIINCNGSPTHMLQAFRGATNSSGHFSKTTT